MHLADDLFKNYSVIEERLVPYGFQKEGNSYHYSCLIHHSEFEVQVPFGNTGTVFSRGVFSFFTN